VKEEAGMEILKDMQKPAASRVKKTTPVTLLMTGKKREKPGIKAARL
jgi:sensor domain CHASE-containing protein